MSCMDSVEADWLSSMMRRRQRSSTPSETDRQYFLADKGHKSGYHPRTRVERAGDVGRGTSGRQCTKGKGWVRGPTPVAHRK